MFDGADKGAALVGRHVDEEALKLIENDRNRPDVNRADEFEQQTRVVEVGGLGRSRLSVRRAGDAIGGLLGKCRRVVRTDFRSW